MKLGVFMTGHFRDAPHTRENYAQFLDYYDTSFYVSTWSTYDVNRQTHELELEPVDVRGQMEAAVGDSLKGMWIGDIEQYYAQPSGPTSASFSMDVRHNVENFLKREDANEQVRSDASWPFVQRVADQAYVTYKAYQLCPREEYDSFDAVIRIRGDMSFIGKEHIPVYHIEDGIHVSSYWWTNKCEDASGLSPFRCSDHLLWGKPKWMRKYFYYYPNYFTRLVPRFRLPQSEFQYNTEHLMALYIQRVPFFRESELDWDWPLNNPNERDCVLHREGNLHDNYLSHSKDGVSYYEFYDLMNKGIR